MVGNREVDDFVIDVTAVDQNIDVLVKANTGKHNQTTLTDGQIYCFNSYNGNLKPTYSISIGASAFFSPLSMLTYEKGKYIFAIVEGTVTADNAYTNVAINSRSYGLLYFSSENRLVDVIYYPSSAFSSNLPVFMSWNIYRSESLSLDSFFPYFVLVADVASSGIPWYVLSTALFRNETMNNFMGGGPYYVLCRNNTNDDYDGTYFWYKHVCYRDNCPNGTYNNYTKGYYYCAECNSLCENCDSTGNCTTCADGRNLTDFTDENNITTTTCTCFNSLDNLGKCQTSCNYGFTSIYQKSCVNTCPSNNLVIGNWVNASSLATRSLIIPYIDNTGGVLQFSNSYQGLKLAAPTTLTADNFPNSFTMTFWVYPTSWKSGVTQFLIQAFGFIYIWKSDQSQGYSYPAAKIGENLLPAPSPTTLKTFGIFYPFQWTFVGLTKRRIRDDKGTEYAEIHLVAATIRANEVPPEPLISDDDYTDFELSKINIDNKMLDTSPQNFKNYILFGGDIIKETDQLAASTSFDGYLREFALKNTYMSVSNLVRQKYRAQNPYSPDLLIYWHFNEQATSNTATLIDYTNNYKSQIIYSQTSSYPRLTSMPTNMTLSLFLWYELFTCRNPLIKLIPTIAGDPRVYESLLNDTSGKYFNFEGASDLFQDGDEIRVMDSFCDAGISHILAKKSLFGLDGNFLRLNFLDNTKPFSSLSRGNDYSLCLYSHIFDVSQLMSWIYIAKIIQVYPQQVLLFLQAQKIVTYQSYNGDDGLDNQLFFSKSVANIENCDGYHCRNISKAINSYNLLSFSTPVLYMGKYNIYWRPIYSSNFSVYSQLDGCFLNMVYVPTIYFSNSYINFL